MKYKPDTHCAPHRSVPYRAGTPRRPYRVWMSGSVAVVMAALLPLRNSNASPVDALGGSLRHSRFSVIETVKRIEETALRHGLTVLARTGGDRPVIVLASSAGGTLVVMNEGNPQPDVPLSVQVLESQDGGADVWISAGPSQFGDEWRDLPAALAHDLASLPGLVDSALG